MKGINYLLLAFCAFVGLCMDMLLAYLIEPIIYGIGFAEWSTWQYIIHWIIISTIWFFVSLIIISISKIKIGFNIFLNKGKMKPWQWIILILCFAIIFIFKFFDGFKILNEFENLGVTKFIFQYIYYIFEIILVTIIIVYSQKAFEVWFKKENFPYGGIIVALSWGIIHIFTKGIVVGLLSLIIGFIFGTIYLLVNRDIKKTIPILFIMFVL